MSGGGNITAAGGGKKPEQQFTIKPPFSLDAYPNLTIKDSCPQFSALTDNASANLLEILPTTKMQSLHKELETLAQQTASRKQRLKQELGALETQLLSPEFQAICASSAAAVSPTQRIKLNLKVSSLPSSSAIDNNNNNNNNGAKSSPVKKRRRKPTSGDASGTATRINGSSAGMAVSSRTAITSSTPVGGAESSTTKLKKRQRLGEADDDTKQSSVEPPPSTVGGGSMPPPPVPGGEPKLIKPSQQILFTTFWNYVDAYFRRFTEDDLKLLEPSNPEDVAPYLIPPKGKSYRECWAEEEKSLLPTAIGANSASAAAGTKSDGLIAKKNRKSLSALKGQTAAVQLDNLGLTADAFCLPLTERFVSAFLDDYESASAAGTEPPADLVPSDAEDSSSTFNSFTPFRPPTKEEMYSIEQRLKSELIHIGLLDQQSLASIGAVDSQADEISVELKRLQGDLRRLTDVNDRRKQILREMVRDRLAYQEYLSVVDEINRQVYACYQRRFRFPGKRRKAVSKQQKQHDGVAELLDRRQRLLSEFAPIFPAERYRLPDRSIFEIDEAELLDQISYLTHPAPIILQKPPSLPALSSPAVAVDTPSGISPVPSSVGGSGAATAADNSSSLNVVSGGQDGGAAVAAGKKKRGPKAGGSGGVRQRKISTASAASIASKTLPGGGGGSGDPSLFSGTASATVDEIGVTPPAASQKERKKRGPKKRKHSEMADKTPPSAAGNITLVDLDSTTLTAADDIPSDDNDNDTAATAQAFLVADGMIPDWMLG